MNVGFPLFINDRGRVESPSKSDHIRQMMELLLFTAPGERVNRPDFGCGLLRLVFATQRPEEVSATRYLVEESLRRWLGELIDVQAVQIHRESGALEISVRYVERETRQSRVAAFEVEAP